MKFCDITMAYNATSGGIKTYIDEKRRFLRENTDHEHLLIIPGSRDRVRRSGRTTTATIKSPLLPGQNAYRVFLTPTKIKHVLLNEAPDIVELGSYYTEPWAAFAYRRRLREAGANCLLSAYFHTDVAKAYVAAPMRAAAYNWLQDVSEALASGVEKLADVAATGAQRYIRYVFSHCDLKFAASPSQAARLEEYGVDDVEIVPMGVDLRLFNPRKRSAEARTRCGANENTTVLMFAGRLCAEKRVLTIIKAFEALPPEMPAQLWLMGDGPQRSDVESAAERNPNIRLFDYESDRTRFAELLASADIYVSAGPFETFGISVLEAQASGLPVIGVNAGALRERVLPGLGALGPVDDPEAMAANIVRAVQERAAIGPRARAHIADQFSWSKALTKLLASYEAKLPVRDEPPPPRAHIAAETLAALPILASLPII
ncbi:MAG TPA: glycosyltransferase [Candidatus Binatia bacterium]|nr:glycosyltransferase [Candidatus Binatia bacterium]